MVPTEKQISTASKFNSPAIAMLLFLSVIFSTASAQLAEPNTPVIRKKPIKAFQLASFTLNNGQRVGGRIISKEPDGFEIAQIDGANITLTKYYRDDIQPRSIIYSKASELDYWRKTGEHFLEKVGDFKDDPDEFIQAIRCFDKAKSAVSDAMGLDHKLVAELDEKIQQAKIEMDKWIELITPRAELRKLEMLSTIDQQFEDMQTKAEANAKELTAIQIKLAGLTATTENYNKIRNRLSEVETLASSFAQRIKRTEDDIYDLRRYYRNRNVYYSTPIIKNNDD